MTISVCMIVKNEEQTLGRILSLVAQFADEIIIVDTGSTDKTVDISKKFTQKVYSFEWKNDFALARNYSLSFATCEYFMWLDADDYITQNNIKKIKALKNSKLDADIFMFKYAMGHNEENKPTFSFFRERLIKNNKNYKFVGFVHEAIELCGKIEYTDIVIEHRKEKEPQKNRNLKLFYYAMRNGVKFSAREYYYFARELFYHNKIYSCIKNLKKFFASQNKLEANEIDAYVILSNCYMIRGEFEKAKQTMQKCVCKFVPTPQVCCQMAKLYESSGKLSLAIWWYQNALKAENKNSGFVDERLNLLVPLVELVKLYYEQGNMHLSVEYHKKAFEKFPTNPSVMFNQEFFVRKGLI